eukprot:scaffold249623_cov20-Prasinocladus_malaysianus.AAC.1
MRKAGHQAQAAKLQDSRLLARAEQMGARNAAQLLLQIIVARGVPYRRTTKFPQCRERLVYATVSGHLAFFHLF